MKSISEHSASHVRDDIRDIRRPATIDERLQYFDTQAHHKAEKYRPAKSGSLVLG